MSVQLSLVTSLCTGFFGSLDNSNIKEFSKSAVALAVECCWICCRHSCVSVCRPRRVHQLASTVLG